MAFGAVADGAAPGMAPAPAPLEAKSSETLATVDKIRNVFPETWLWTNSTVGADGSVTIETVMPDTITSWIASAFAVNTQTGLGIASSSAKVEAFKPFFVSLNLPYSVVRGEELALQANVFNYMSQDLDVLVTLKASNDFRNIKVDASGVTSYVSEQQETTVTVPAGEAKSVFFPIIPAALGQIPLTVTAQSTLAADGVKRMLLVEPEGVPKEYSNPILIDLKNASSFNEIVHLSLPDGVVAGSERVVVTAIGDLMGPTVNNLDKLLRMPTGCGEQTMIGFAPDVFVTNYLTATSQLTGEIEEKAIGFLESGYQRELTYQHTDGSFSAFGDQDDSGSMWLTAFVTKSFHQAKKQIYIDDDVIIRALNWVVNHQNKDGSFPEPGRVIHKDMQGEAGSGVGLTSFVLISLLENNDLGGDAQSRIDDAAAKAAAYLENQLPTISDPYVLSLTNYALQLASSAQSSTAYTMLEKMAIMEDGTVHWHKDSSSTSSSHWRPSRSQANPVDIEMTAYALLVMATKGDFTAGMPIMKWITQQRNSNGGFSSTQDTVVALQALSDFAAMAYSDSFDIQATITADNMTHTFSINKQNALVLQSVVLPAVPSDVMIEATGHGIALVDVQLSFYVEQEIEEVSFDVNVTMVEETLEFLSVQTCTTWLQSGASGMAIQEIGVPTGFEADLESLEGIKEIKRMEVEDRKVILYFDEISTKPICLTLDVYRVGMVAKSQPVAVRVYDYYQPSNQVTSFYQSQLLKGTGICDVCEHCGCPRA